MFVRPVEASARASANSATALACGTLVAGSETGSTVRADAVVVCFAADGDALLLLVDFEEAGVETSWGSGDSAGFSAAGVCVGGGGAVPVGAAVSDGEEGDSGSAGVFVVPVALELPVLVWALTTTPPATVFDVVLDVVVVVVVVVCDPDV
jgi:hypothetical protein